MRIRGSILWFVVIVATLTAVLLWLGRKPTAETSAVVSMATNVAPPTSASNVLTSTPASNNAQPTRITSANAPQSPPPQNKVAVLKEILQANDAEVVFYGRLEDQFSNAVSGTVINFSVQYEDATSRGIHRGKVESDANGLFTISGYVGANLTIMPVKPGYVLATTGTSFRYSQLEPGYFIPETNNPTVIKMWKLQRAEPLVQINKTFRLAYTATPIYFDLIAGSIVPSGGDLRIAVNRPAGVISGRNPQDWSIGFQVIDGGFIETSPNEAGVTFLAPDSGYQASGTFGKNNGPALLDKTLFIQSRNGQVYSKIHFLFGINTRPDGFMYFTFDGVANTNSSRDWEADPNMTKSIGQ